MKKVIFSIGIPGSGKSTHLRQLADKYNYHYICPDDIRGEINRDPISQTNMQLVWETAYMRMQKALNEGLTVVFDSSMANRRDRENFIKIAMGFGAKKVQALSFETAFDVAKERNAGRERIVPEYVLDRMQKALDLEPPDAGEGVYSLFRFDSDGCLNSIQSNPSRIEGSSGESREG